MKKALLALRIVKDKICKSAADIHADCCAGCGSVIHRFSPALLISQVICRLGKRLISFALGVNTTNKND